MGATPHEFESRVLRQPRGPDRISGPALWRFLGYWARLSDTTGELGDIIANGNATGQAIIKIDSGGKAFQTSDCKSWQRIG
ncbi:hypothetical protein AB0F25_26655 [Streptomyces wedmorensis]|uniref:hypothetical protein n=1 Tax=Streptomyces wedmorensis TaxID=43759 RepID=UPI003415AE36